MKNIHNYDKINNEGVRDIYMKKEKEYTLSKYKFPTRTGKDGYFRIYVTDSTKASGRKQIAAKTVSELMDKVYDYEKSMADGKAEKSFSHIFEIVQAEKLKYVKNPEKRLSVQNTIGRNRTEYKRYFGGTEFEKMHIDRITKADIEDVIYMNLTRYSLRRKGFASMMSILRNVFDYAYQEYLIQDNIFKRINFKKYDGLIEADVPIENRVHSDEDLKRIINYIHDYQKKKPYYLPAYALELQIIMGLRRGEVPPLMYSDIHGDEYIEISKEQLTVKKNGGDIKEYYAIVNHTKTYKNRKFPMTDDLKDFFVRYNRIRSKIFPKSQYLFPCDNENGVITNSVVYQFYYRMCNKLDIEVCKQFIKGTHSFRRNAITDVVNNTNGNIILASQLFGNSPEVAQKNYFTGINMHIAMEALNKRKMYEKA
jgi:integrase